MVLFKQVQKKFCWVKTRFSEGSLDKVFREGRERESVTERGPALCDRNEHNETEVMSIEYRHARVSRSR